MSTWNMPPGVTTNDIPGNEPETLESAYAQGRADQLEDDLRLLAWAYRKLHHVSWTKQEDALAMDEIKLMLMGGA